MRLAPCVASSIILSVPAAAQPTLLNIHLSNFKFDPAAIELKANSDYALTLTNDGSGGHSFAAKEFFATAKVDAPDQKAMKDGKIEVPGNRSVTIHFRTAGPGTYKVKCTHAFHSGFGMKGEIVVR